MKRKISIISLSYVRLPLSVTFTKKYETIGLEVPHNYYKKLNTKITNNIILYTADERLQNK